MKIVKEDELWPLPATECRSLEDVLRWLDRNGVFSYGAEVDPETIHALRNALPPGCPLVSDLTEAEFRLKEHEEFSSHLGPNAPAYRIGWKDLPSLVKIWADQDRNQEQEVPSIDGHPMTAVQRAIWNALDRCAFTKEKLAEVIDFVGSTVAAHIKPMMTHGIVKNDRAIGGYYRPDSPPDEIGPKSD